MAIPPIQPIVDGRFKPNAIVRRLLEEGPFDMNDIAMWDVSVEDEEQFAMLIGYSLSGFGTLSYVRDETYNAAEQVADGADDMSAKIAALEGMLAEIRAGLRAAAAAAFAIHLDDLSETMP